MKIIAHRGLINGPDKQLENNPENIHLTKGAMFCEIKITDNGVFIVCKNIGYTTKHFQIKMDECLVFQKLTSQEQVLLSALDHLSK